MTLSPWLCTKVDKMLRNIKLTVYLPTLMFVKVLHGYDNGFNDIFQKLCKDKLSYVYMQLFIYYIFTKFNEVLI